MTASVSESENLPLAHAILRDVVPKHVKELARHNGQRYNPIYGGPTPRFIHEGVLSGLLTAVGFNAVALAEAEKEPHLYSAAYFARNLLELCVWTEYCCSTSARAERFASDSIRDANGIRDTMMKLGSSPQSSTIQDPYAGLVATAKRIGVDPSDAKYLKVSDAAKEVGLLDDFYLPYNKMYSKLAHPTALMVVGMQSVTKNEAPRAIRTQLIWYGATMAAHCVECVARALKGMDYDVDTDAIRADYEVLIAQLSV